MFLRSDLNSKSIPCTLCEQHIYCSAACQQQHSKLHAWQCSTLQELEVICTTTNADVDLIRAALCVVAQWEQDRVDSSDETIASTVAVPCLFTRNYYPISFQDDH
jgi:hypothetical protein